MKADQIKCGSRREKEGGGEKGARREEPEKVVEVPGAEEEDKQDQAE